MADFSLSAFSDHVADIVAHAAASVVQVRGRRRLASGSVFGEGLVMTMAPALGSEDGLRVRTHDGHEIDVEVRGWDPATGLVVLRGNALNAPSLQPGQDARVGHLVFPVGRSWSGALTASSGIISVIGGPLPTGRGHSIDRVIRTTAQMHSGFVGGPVLGADGTAIGVAAAGEIRGMRIVIPADIAWRVAGSLSEHGTPRRGYLGVAGQAARVPATHTGAGPTTTGVVVVDVAQGSPAESGGILVGDVIVSFDDKPVRSPMDILGLLEERRAGHSVLIGILRGGVAQQVPVTIGERSSARD